MQLDAATVLAQWAAGGLLFLWVTSRHRVLGVGYGWLLRSIYAALGLGAVSASLAFAEPSGSRSVFVAGTVGMVGATLGALGVSIVTRRTPDRFPPVLDLVAPLFGACALAGAAGIDGFSALDAGRIFTGAAFLGAVTDAMLLGHWYLVQPGLSRDPLRELVRWTMWIWPVEVLLLLWPVGMASVLNGSISDGYGGLLGWMWVVSALTTLGLAVATWFALREAYYSAVMAATGLLYLAILTAFGTDLVARALLAP